VLLKDASKGLPFVDQLKQLAAQTPLAFAGIDQAAKSLLGYGVQAGNIVETIRMLGDLAMGDQGKLQNLALAYGQIMSLGKANLQDLKQLVNAGVPIFDQLSKQKGKSIAEIQEMVSAGKIGAGEVQQALASLTAEGGIFHGMMEKMAKTAEGRLSTALDDLKDSAASLMEDALPLAKDVLEYVSKIANTIKGLDDTQRQALLTALGVAAVSGLC
jgi:tape measure domain-containing protein